MTVTADMIREHRERREARVREIAVTLAPGDYHAYDNFVVNSTTREIVAECATHWDACLVMMAVSAA